MMSMTMTSEGGGGGGGGSIGGLLRGLGREISKIIYIYIILEIIYI